MRSMVLMARGHVPQSLLTCREAGKQVFLARGAKKRARQRAASVLATRRLLRLVTMRRTRRRGDFAIDSEVMGSARSGTDSSNSSLLSAGRATPTNSLALSSLTTLTSLIARGYSGHQAASHQATTGVLQAVEEQMGVRTRSLSLHRQRNSAASSSLRCTASPSVMINDGIGLSPLLRARSLLLGCRRPGSAVESKGSPKFNQVVRFGMLGNFLWSAGILQLESN